MTPLSDWFFKKAKLPLLLLIALIALAEVSYLLYWQSENKSRQNQQIERIIQLMELAVDQKNRVLVESLLDISRIELKADFIVLCEKNVSIVSIPGGKLPCERETTTFKRSIKSTLKGENNYSILFVLPRFPPTSTLLLLILSSVALLAGCFLVIARVQKVIKTEILDPLSGDIRLEKSMQISEMDTIRKNIVEREELLQNQKISETIVSLSDHISHDIKSPLSTLKIISSTVIEKPIESSKLLKLAVDRIERIINDLSKVNDLKNFDTPYYNIAEPCYLDKILQEVIQEKSIEFGNVKINLNISSNENKQCLINSSDFKRILSNMINNSVEALKNSSGSIDIQLSATDGLNIIDIIDDGMGIAKDIQHKIFKKNFSHKKNGGKGLGLYYAKQTLNHWSGDISYLNKNKGCHFQISLPFIP